MIPVTPTTITVFLKSYKLWLGIFFILAVILAGWWGYETLKDNIRLEIENQITKKAADFKQESTQVSTEATDLNQEVIEKIRSGQRKEISALNTKLLALERLVKAGSMTEIQRREEAAAIRYNLVLLAYCKKQIDSAKCQSELGAMP